MIGWVEKTFTVQCLVIGDEIGMQSPEHIYTEQPKLYVLCSATGPSRLKCPIISTIPYELISTLAIHVLTNLATGTAPNFI